MKYYKVVKKKHKKLYSANAMRHENVRYIKNKWVVPRKNCNQWLYTFGDLQSALNYKSTYEYDTVMDLRVYECEIGKSLKRKCIVENTVTTDKVKILKRIR